MALHPVDKIWWLQINANDYKNTEWDKDPGAKSQQHYDVPRADLLLSFLGKASDFDQGQGAELAIEAQSIGNPGPRNVIPFSLRKGTPTDQVIDGEPVRRKSGRARISLQNVFSSKHQRHPAWSKTAGSWPVPANPKAEDLAEAEKIATSGLLIYVVKTIDDGYFAGFTTGNTDKTLWPDVVKDLLPAPDRVVRGGKRTGVIHVQKSAQLKYGDLSPLAQKVVRSLSRNKNVLLYGPPGTGKTFALNQVRQFLALADGVPEVNLDDTSMDEPIKVLTKPFTIPAPSRVEFVTFHQDFGYEDFVVGLRPIRGQSLTLQPFAGILLDCAISVSEQEHGFKSSVIMVDEMNRGNVPKILGDFLTYMDDTYRLTQDGKIDKAIPVRLAKVLAVRDDNGHKTTEPIKRLGGDSTPLPIPWHFPHHVYLLATMNSVDKSVAPLDSAIGRRFERIDAFPDLNALADQLGISLERRDQLLRPSVPTISGAVTTPSASEDEEFSTDGEFSLSEADVAQESGDVGSSPDEAEAPQSPQELALSLLKSINDFIDDALGADFELGHAYFWSIKTENDLIAVWDTLVWPQVRDRFGARPQELLKLLRANQEGRPAKYAFALRSATSKHVLVEPLSDMETADAMATLRFLANQ